MEADLCVVELLIDRVNESFCSVPTFGPPYQYDKHHAKAGSEACAAKVRPHRSINTSRKDTPPK